MMLKDFYQYFFQNKHLLPFLLLIIIGLLLHFVWLERFPVGLSHDDAEVVLSAKTYWLFGTDTSGTSFMTSVFSNLTEGGLSGLPSILLSPIIGIFPLSLVMIRMPYVLINIATVILLSALINKITKDRILSLIIFMVGLLNPWLFVYSRSPTEAPVALFFVMLGIYLFFSTQGKKIIMSSISFVLAFYSYFGAKPVILVLLLAIPFIKKVPNRLLFLFIGLFFVGIYFVSYFSSQQGTFSERAGKELVISNLDRYSEIVGEQRRSSIDFPLKNFFYSKYSQLAHDVSHKALGTLDPDFLFFSGDNPSIYRFEDHGVFYLIEFPLMIIGIFSLGKYWKKNRELVLLISSGFVIGVIPSAVSQIGDSYFFRGFFLVPWFVVLISLGIRLLSKYKLAIYLLSVLYFVSFVSFLSFFFFRYSVKEQENHFLSGRVMSNYLIRLPSDQKVSIVTTSPHAAYHQYLFYSNFRDANEILFEQENYSVGNVTFYPSCDDLELNDQNIVIVDSRLNCNVTAEETPSGIYNQKDAGVQFLIYNDNLCRDVQLDSWRRFHYISDYAIENTNKEVFCNRWVQKI